MIKRFHAFLRYSPKISTVIPVQISSNAQEVDALITSATGLTSIDVCNPQDVFIAGYPKSGNTWFQVIIAGIIYGLHPENLSDALVQDLVPDVQYRRFYRRYLTPMFFKTHLPPRPEYKKVIYLLRDGRDVMVSFYHHTCALERRTIDFADFFERIEKREMFSLMWHEHVNLWASNPYNAEIHVIKYEELKQNGLQVLSQLCDFLNIKKSQDYLQSVLDASAFDKMRAREENLGWEQVGVWPKDKRFIRRGVIGSYKDELSQPILDKFLSQSEEMLRKYDYL